jgi:hypothetical protein
MVLVAIEGTTSDVMEKIRLYAASEDTNFCSIAPVDGIPGEAYLADHDCS